MTDEKSTPTGDAKSAQSAGPSMGRRPRRRRRGVPTSETTTRTAQPAAEAPRAAEPAQAPRDRAESRPERSEAPRDRAESRPERSEAPRDRAESRPERSEAPRDRAESRPERSEAPRDRAESRPERSEAPRDRAESRPERSEAPRDRAESRPERSEAPRDRDAGPPVDRASESERGPREERGEGERRTRGRRGGRRRRRPSAGVDAARQGAETAVAAAAGTVGGDASSTTETTETSRSGRGEGRGSSERGRRGGRGGESREGAGRGEGRGESRGGRDGGRSRDRGDDSRRDRPARAGGRDSSRGEGDRGGRGRDGARGGRDGARGGRDGGGRDGGRGRTEGDRGGRGARDGGRGGRDGGRAPAVRGQRDGARGRRPRQPQDLEINQDLKPTDALQLPPGAVCVLIAGGGTGGHVVPAIAIGEALRRRNAQSRVVILGSDRGIEADLVPKAGFDLVELKVKPFPKSGLGKIKAGFSLLGAVRQVSAIIRKVNPDVVVGTGGYVSVAAIIAARLARKPVLLQEQNSIPGRANRFLSRWADEIHIHFTETRRHFKDKGKLRLSGNPVRIKLSEGRALRTLEKYRLERERRTVLILGGSQGARSLNDAFREMLPHFKDDRTVQFIIQTGKSGYRPVLDSVRNSGVRVVVKSFINNMEEIYGVSDLAVARAGAMTVSELAASGLPGILVPYPHAADDHQTANALSLAEKDAAVLLPDKQLSGDVLAAEIRRVLDDEGVLRRMGANVYRLSRPEAARHIAEAVEALAGAAPDTILNLPEDYEEEAALQEAQ